MLHTHLSISHLRVNGLFSDVPLTLLFACMRAIRHPLKKMAPFRDNYWGR